MMGRRPRLPISMSPYRIVILAVDPGRTSGYAVLLDGQPVEWGALDAADSARILGVLERTLRLAARTGRPAVLVGETWGRGGKLNPATIGGLEAAWKAWQWPAEHLEAVEGERFVRGRIRRVHTARWRGRLFRQSRLRTSVAKSLAVASVRHRYGIELRADQHDAAEALCIGWYSTYAGEIGQLPRVRR